jgi:hypothetical protein
MNGARSMPILDDDRLREIVCDDGLPGITYILVWGELDEDSRGYKDLSQVLFGYEAGGNPDDAPSKDLSDPAVRQGVFDCALRHSDVRDALENVLSEISAVKRAKPWWRFW